MKRFRSWLCAAMLATICFSLLSGCGIPYYSAAGWRRAFSEGREAHRPIDAAVVIEVSTVERYVSSFHSAQRDSIMQDLAELFTRPLSGPDGSEDYILQVTLDVSARNRRPYDDSGLKVVLLDSTGVAIATFFERIEWRSQVSQAAAELGRALRQTRAWISKTVEGEHPPMRRCGQVEVAPLISRASAEAYNDRGLAYSRKGQYDQAIADYNKALEINPRYALAYNNRGIAFWQKGQYDQAIADHNKALEIDPKYADAYLNRGSAFGSKGRYEQAISDFTKAMGINPRLAMAYNNRGFAYYRKGQYDQAMADYNKALEIDPRLGLAYLNRGTAYDSKGQYDQAIADFNNALEINPRDALAYYNLASAYYNRAGVYYYKKDYDKAWEDLYRAQGLGFKIHPGFLEDLREASGREK